MAAGRAVRGLSAFEREAPNCTTLVFLLGSWVNHGVDGSIIGNHFTLQARVVRSVADCERAERDREEGRGI